MFCVVYGDNLCGNTIHNTYVTVLCHILNKLIDNQIQTGCDDKTGKTGPV